MSTTYLGSFTFLLSLPLSLKRKCPPEVSVRILWILSNDYIKVVAGELMLTNHLVGLSSFMYVSEVAWNLFYALSQWKDCLFELFKATICDSKVVIDIRLVGQEGLVTQR